MLAVHYCLIRVYCNYRYSGQVARSLVDRPNFLQKYYVNSCSYEMTISFPCAPCGAILRMHEHLQQVGI
jgi:hypothetical protein